MSAFKYFENLEQKLEQIKTDEFYRPYLEELKATYEENKEADTVLDYQSFMCFFTTGSRLEYETKYFARRSRLCVTLILYLLYKEQHYLDELCETIWQICSQITWVYPAHLRGIEVEDYRTHIDLGAAETAHSLAEVDYLVGDALPERIRALIRHEVKERIFDAYESRPYFWEKLENNWPGVCGGSVGMAYMYLAPERFEKVKDRLLEVMETFKRSYGEDGSNTEGISYWQYGFWMYLNFADMLYHYSEGKIDIRHLEKVEKMARFPLKTVMRGYITVSFSDSARVFPFENIGLFTYLKKNYEGYEILPPKTKELGKAGWSKSTFTLRNFLWSDPECLKTQTELKMGMEYLPDAQWYMVRKPNYSFSAKGGHNDEGHNHNDVGNFVLATDNGQMIADMGAMEYTAKCFSSERYTLLQNSSRGHSVPIIDGKEQGAGRRYHASVREVTDTRFSMEIQEAYVTDIPKILRTFELAEDGITMTDEYETIEGHEIVERFISVVEPVVDGNKIYIGDIVLGAEGLLKITKDAVKDKKQRDEYLWLIDYQVTEKKFVMEIQVGEK